MWRFYLYASLLSHFVARCSGFAIVASGFDGVFARHHRTSTTCLCEAADRTVDSPAPVLNGKRVLPFKVLTAGLAGHQVAAVYAVLDSTYRRNTDGWEAVVHVGCSQDLASSLQAHVDKHGANSVAHLRALSFSFPQPNAMQDVAQQWRQLAVEAGANLHPEWGDDVLDYLYDEDDDDDDDEDWSMEMTSQAMASVPPPPAAADIVSPFEDGAPEKAAGTSDGPLTFTREAVDQVLDEVRPYLIADGGNVAVQRVDEATGNVYLKLEGACGSCASSTVTMQMGIERVLKENFGDQLGQVLQVEDDPESKPTELSWEAVESEVNRLKPAITAMGGVCQIVGVDPIGVVELKFRGSNKVQQGLELALRDVPLVKHVKFTSID